MHELLNELGAERCLRWADRSWGLPAVAVIDDVTLGPAAASGASTVEVAERLARERIAAAATKRGGA